MTAADGFGIAFVIVLVAIGAAVCLVLRGDLRRRGGRGKMKITIWLRNAEDKTDGATLRLDVKYESYDNMLVRRYGEKLVKAIESGGEKTE